MSRLASLCILCLVTVAPIGCQKVEPIPMTVTRQCLPRGRGLASADDTELCGCRSNRFVGYLRYCISCVELQSKPGVASDR